MSSVPNEKFLLVYEKDHVRIQINSPRKICTILRCRHAPERCELATFSDPRHADRNRGWRIVLKNIFTIRDDPSVKEFKLHVLQMPALYMVKSVHLKDGPYYKQ